MITNPLSIATRAAVIGGLAISAATLVPGIASAGDTWACAGVSITATANGQTLQGTSCNDTFNLERYVHVTVLAGGGNDTVYAGFVGHTGMNWLYLGDGNDRVINNHNKSVWVEAGAGNDVIQGSSGYDYINGGNGTDTASITPGDDYSSIEIYA